MKLFAQRYTYLGNEVVPPPFGIDAIASHDLQTPLRTPSVMIPQQLLPAATPLVPHPSPPPTHTYAQPAPSIPPAIKQSQQRVASPIAPPKRPLPELDHGVGQKRVRRSSPPPLRRPPPSAPGGRRWGSPSRDDRRRERSPERLPIPSSILWFLAQLPNATAYDGWFRSLFVRLRLMVDRTGVQDR